MSRTALVTGASRGIGAAIVETLTAKGYAVTALARPSPALDALCARTGAEPLAVDLTDTAGLDLALRGRAPDVLVNNAGIVTGVGPLSERTAGEIDRTIAVNVTAVLHTLRLLLPAMVARGSGDVVLLGSIAGRYAAPGMAVYAASKAAIRMLVNALRLDLHGSGVRVTEVAPGRVATDIYLEASGGDREAMRRRLYAQYQASLPADIAQAVVAALEMPRRSNVAFMEVVPTRQAAGGFVFAEGFDDP